MTRPLTVGIIAGLLATPLCAAEESLGLTLAQIEAERRSIIKEVVAPTEEQVEDFWTSYWLYRGGVKLLTDRIAERSSKCSTPPDESMQRATLLSTTSRRSG